MGFCSLQHVKDPRSTQRGRKPARYVPPSGFGYPLGGLLPRIPCRFSFAPAALMGFTLRRFPSRKVLPAFRPEGTHLPFDPAVILPPEGARPARRTSVSGLIPPESALRPRGVLIRRPLAPPMGFAPSRACRENLEPGLLRASSRTLHGSWRLLAELAGASEYQSAFAPLRPTQHRSAHRPKQPFWGPCTCLIQSIRAHQRPGY
jgi:hypothetical protein